jgi:hypothetical protein
MLRKGERRPQKVSSVPEAARGRYVQVRVWGSWLPSAHWLLASELSYIFDGGVLAS